MPWLPWWGWALIVLAVLVIVPVKIKILRRMLDKSDNGREDF